MYVARNTAQIRATTPWSMLGGRGGCGITAIVVEEEVVAPQPGADQKKSPSRSRFRPQRRSTFRFGPCGPPRTTSRCCFVLLPRRARRMRESRASSDLPQGAERGKNSQFADVE